MAVSSSGLVVSYSSRNLSVAIITGNMIHITGTGSTNITASQPGDDDYLPASDVQQLLIVDKANQTISFGPLADVTYGSSDINPGATSTAGLEVTYSTNNPAIASIESGLIVINGAGNVVITASQTGNDDYYPASDVEQALVVLKAEQTITFPPLPEVKLGDEPISAEAIASSGLDITYSSSNLSIAVITNGLIGITGAGTAIIMASQPGDQNYNPASDISQILTVIKADQVITFPPIAPVVYGVSGFNGGASSSSGLAITYGSENSLVAEVMNDYIYIRGVGNTNIIASQSGDNNFNPAEDKMVSLTVTKAPLTITADNKTKTFLSINPPLTYTCTGFVYGENIAVLDVPPTISTEAGQNSPVGDYVITVSGGNDNCYDFIYITGILTITKIPQTITFTSYPDKLLINEAFELAAVATSGLPVSFESKNLQVARITGSTLTGISLGNADVKAYQPGNENYDAAEAEISIEVISTHENILHLFSPNNDGFNDYWEIPDLESYGKCEVRVYNRWGKLVFSSPDYHNEWDGTSNGVDLPSAAYYFIIKSETEGTITGTVNIVR
jgi:gliding motility-associated-like protein